MTTVQKEIRSALNGALSANAAIREAYKICDNPLAEIIVCDLISESVDLVKKLERLNSAIGE